jgi:hypothetical protein
LEVFVLLTVLLFLNYSTTINTEEMFVKVPSKEEKVEIIKPLVIDDTLINPVEKVIIFQNQLPLENL